MKTILRTDIINKLFEIYNFKSYLEIGVHYPSLNFDKINCIDKDSVDPNPQGHCTYIMTSDIFFKSFVNNKKYDVIFVDGLHTAEQVYVDIKNSLNHLNEEGFIVVHDCNPLEEFHIRPHSEYSVGSGAWTGTVYMGFLKIKNELTDYTCFTIDEDWGVGIITKRKLQHNQLTDFDLNSLSWGDFDKNRNDLLQLVTYDDYLNLLK